MIKQRAGLFGVHAMVLLCCTACGAQVNPAAESAKALPIIGTPAPSPLTPVFTPSTSVTVIKMADEGYPQEEPLLNSGPQGTLYLSLPHVPALYRSDDRADSWHNLFDTRTGVGQATAGGNADGAI